MGFPSIKAVIAAWFLIVVNSFAAVYVSVEGDSIVYGQQSSDPAHSNFVAWLNLLVPTLKTTNMGVSGARIEDNTNALKTLNALTNSPIGVTRSNVMFYYGHNDIAQLYSLAYITTNILTWSRNVKALFPTANQVGMTLHMINYNAGGSEATMQQRRLDVNSWIRTNGCFDYVCDIASDSRFTNFLDTTYYNGDEVHFNDNGYYTLGVFVLNDLVTNGLMSDYYYVSSDGGTSKLGTLADPFAMTNLTVGFWNSLNNSSTYTIYFHGGTYTNKPFSVKHTVTPTLYLKPSSSSPHPTGIDGQVLFTMTTGTVNMVSLSGGCKNMVFDGETSVGSGTINWTFQIGTNTVFDWGGTGSSYSSNKFRYIEFTGMLSNGTKIFQNATADGTEVERCWFHDNDGADECQISATTGSYGSVKIHHCLFSNVTANVMSSVMGVDFYNNTVIGDYSVYPYDLLHIYGAGGDRIQYWRIHDNIMRNEDQIIFVENTTGVGTREIQIYNNVFGNRVAGSGKPIILWDKTDGVANTNIFIANNTFYNTAWGIQFLNSAAPNYSSSFVGLQVLNNIFVDCAHYPVVSSGTTNTWNPDSQGTLNFNMAYETSGAVNVNWQGPTPGTWKNYTSFGATWTADHPTMLSNLISNPLFANASANDFRLQSTSPALNSGTNLSSYFTTDITGAARSGWSMGAYESGTNVSTPSIMRVSGTLRVGSVGRPSP